MTSKLSEMGGKFLVHSEVSKIKGICTVLEVESNLLRNSVGYLRNGCSSN